MAEAFDLVIVDEKTLPLVQHLRYRVYVAEKGFALAGADHASRRVFDAADSKGTSFALFDGPDLASSAQVVTVDPRAPGPGYDVFALRDNLPDPSAKAVVVSKLVTAPERRGQKTLGPILKAILEFVKVSGARYIAILVEPQMVKFYASMGFDERATGIDAPPYGVVSLMVFDMQDERHISGKSLAGWMFKSLFQSP